MLFIIIWTGNVPTLMTQNKNKSFESMVADKSHKKYGQHRQEKLLAISSNKTTIRNNEEGSYLVCYLIYIVN